MKIYRTGSLLAFKMFMFFCSQAQGQDVLVSCGAETNTDTVRMLVGRNADQALIIPTTNDHNGMAMRAGMIVYNSTENTVYYCDGSSWRNWGGNIFVTTKKGSQPIDSTQNDTRASGANNAAGIELLNFKTEVTYP